MTRNEKLASRAPREQSKSAVLGGQSPLLFFQFPSSRPRVRGRASPASGRCRAPAFYDAFTLTVSAHAECIHEESDRTESFDGRPGVGGVANRLVIGIQCWAKKDDSREAADNGGGLASFGKSERSPQNLLLTV